MMDMWEDRDVPGITCKRAGFESRDVVGTMFDDGFHNFMRKGFGALDGRGLRSCAIA